METADWENGYFASTMRQGASQQASPHRLRLSIAAVLRPVPFAPRRASNSRADPLPHTMLAHRLRYLWYLLAGATRAPAARLGQQWWEDDYARGSLARTEGEVELPRHLLVAGLARHYAPGASVLDVGCGTGGLTIPLRAAFAGRSLRYLGVDLAESALRRAETRVDAEADATGEVRFVQADFDEYRPQQTFDVIIFSESLYYAPEPLQTVRRYTSALTPGGIVIVSMWRRPSRKRVWRVLGTELRERSRSRLVVPLRPAWDIVVFSPP